jgi:hypothetical protein
MLAFDDMCENRILPVQYMQLALALPSGLCMFVLIRLQVI